MSAGLQTKFHETMNNLEARMEHYEFMRSLQTKTGVQKRWLAVGGGTLVAFFLFFGLGAEFVSNLVGFAYPAYASFKALETKSLEDDKQWLTYWVVFASLTLLETFSGFLLYWFPPYYSLKLAFLVYLFMPYTKGATFIYDQFLAPFMRKHFGSGPTDTGSAPAAAGASADVGKKA